MRDGEVQETGDFELDGVTFPAAEIQLEFIDPSDDGDAGAMFPTGNLVDTLDVPGVGSFEVTMITAGIPTIFLNAADLGYTGIELQPAINEDKGALERFEKIRLRRLAHGSDQEPGGRGDAPAHAEGGVRCTGSGLRVVQRQGDSGVGHRPACARVVDGQAASRDDGYRRRSDRHCGGDPGTLVNRAAGGGERKAVTFGHPSGTLRVGAQAALVDGQWTVTKAIMSRSARVLMEGKVRVPAE